jgi:hypothetical protein
LGVLDVGAGMRGGIAAVRRGSVADTGGAAVSLPCRGEGTSRARCWLVTQASRGRGGREKRKGVWRLGASIAERSERHRSGAAGGRRES